MCNTTEIKIIDAKHSIISEDVIDIVILHDGKKYSGTLFCQKEETIEVIK